MAWEIQDRFPTWGETGEYPANGFFYEGGDQVNEKHQDALWNGIKNFEQNVRDSLTDIDSDGDGIVDAANQLKTGGSTATIRDTTNALDVAQFDEGGNVKIPNGQLSEQGNRVATRNWVTGNNIALDDLSNVTASGEGSGNGLDADTVDGKDASAFADSGHLHDSRYLQSSDYNPESDTHSRYSDSEARSAVNNSNVNVGYADSAGDADTLDGYDGAGLLPLSPDSVGAVNEYGEQENYINSSDGSNWHTIVSFAQGETIYFCNIVTNFLNAVRVTFENGETLTAGTTSDTSNKHFSYNDGSGNYHASLSLPYMTGVTEIEWSAGQTSTNIPYTTKVLASG